MRLYGASDQRYCILAVTERDGNHLSILSEGISRTIAPLKFPLMKMTRRCFETECLNVQFALLAD